MLSFDFLEVAFPRIENVIENGQLIVRLETGIKGSHIMRCDSLGILFASVGRPTSSKGSSPQNAFFGSNWFLPGVSSCERTLRTRVG